jgi:hypothetical protein
MASLTEGVCCVRDCAEYAPKRLQLHNFRDSTRKKRIQNETQALVVWRQARKLTAAGSAQLARYDPPWTLPIWRRNEIHMDVYLL